MKASSCATDSGVIPDSDIYVGEPGPVGPRVSGRFLSSCPHTSLKCHGRVKNCCGLPGLSWEDQEPGGEQSSKRTSSSREHSVNQPSGPQLGRAPRARLAQLVTADGRPGPPRCIMGAACKFLFSTVDHPSVSVLLARVSLSVSLRSNCHILGC